jgi:hypothetical protein
MSFHRVKDAVLSVLGVEDGYVKHQEWIVHATPMKNSAPAPPDRWSDPADEFIDFSCFHR